MPKTLILTRSGAQQDQDDQQNTMTLWKHADFGMLTPFSQDEAGGLEVEDHSLPGSFISIQLEAPTDMSVCVSATLEPLSNNHLRAVAKALHHTALNLMETRPASLPPQMHHQTTMNTMQRRPTCQPKDLTILRKLLMYRAIILWK